MQADHELPRGQSRERRNYGCLMSVAVAREVRVHVYSGLVPSCRHWRLITAQSELDPNSTFASQSSNTSASRPTLFIISYRRHANIDMEYRESRPPRRAYLSLKSCPQNGIRTLPQYHPWVYTTIPVRETCLDLTTTI